MRTVTPQPSSYVKVERGNIPDTLVPEIYLIMASPLKCVAVLFRLSPEGKYNTVNYQSLQRVSTMPQSTLDKASRQHNFSVITLETAGIQTLNPGVGR